MLSKKYAVTREDYYVALGIAPGPVNAKGVYGEAEYTGHYGTSSTKMLGDYNVPDNWPQNAHRPEPGGVPGPPVQYEKPMNPDDAAAGYGYQASISSEPETFFYHSDHLGSTAYVTDRDGRATQFVVYMPYGESLVDEHAVSYESPFKFNGKELDTRRGCTIMGLGIMSRGCVCGMGWMRWRRSIRAWAGMFIARGIRLGWWMWMEGRL